MAKVCLSHPFLPGVSIWFCKYLALGEGQFASLSLPFRLCAERGLCGLSRLAPMKSHIWQRMECMTPLPASSLPPASSPSSEKVKLKATSMMAKVQVWNVSIVCVQLKNNISRRVQSLQVAPLGLLLFQSRGIYPRKRGKWRGNRVHMLWKYAGRDWRKNNILPQGAALFLNFFFFPSD